MRELLHSKTFKKNLTKWIFMYVGVIVCITSVITYSRYISSLQAKGEGRVAKFNVSINYPETVNCGSGTGCNIGTSRPHQYYDYDFILDTSDIEVSTLLYLNININVDLELLGLYTINGNSESALSGCASVGITTINSSTTENKCEIFTSTNDNNSSTNKLALVKTINAGNGETTHYRLKVKYRDYDSTKSRDTLLSSIRHLDEDIIIGYSAKQIN